MDIKIILKKTTIEGVYFGEINHFQDHRGKFMRLYDYKEISKKLNQPIVEVNLSQNNFKGTVRGLHFENTETKSFKIISCIKGMVVDKVVDIRKSSKTFLSHESFVLDEKDNQLLFIPNKVAHGFQTQMDDTHLLYMHTMGYDSTIEGGLNTSDPMLNINWEIQITQMSKRDKDFNYLKQNFDGI